MRVLLVEDDEMIGEVVSDALKEAAHAVDWLRTGAIVANLIATQSYDLILLDLGLPERDGLDVLRAIRATGNTIPILIITARDALEERIAGLDGGADDYLLKPFELSELLARMRAVLRRKGGVAAPILSNGSVALDPATREATVAEKGNVPLSNREFSLLQALMARPGAILSRPELEERIYGWGEEVESNAVEFLIHALRKKLGSDIIKNVRGVGWKVSKGE